MPHSNAPRTKLIAVMMGLMLLAGCVTPVPPPPPPALTPLPPVKYVPPRPLPPGGATINMYVPPRDLNGVRQTVNYGLSTPQTIWNLRSGLNVAALNCRKPQYEPIIPAYRTFLDTKKGELTSVNKQLRAAYTDEYGSDWRPQFDRYMTQVYNYYALPPAQIEFCDAALEIANTYALTPERELDAFATAYLPRLEIVFDNFYSAMEKYRTDVVAWDAEYAPETLTSFGAYGASDPGTASASPSVYEGAVIRNIEVAPSTTQGEPLYGPSSVPPFTEATPPSGTETPPVFVSNPVVEPIAPADTGSDPDGADPSGN